MGKDLKRNLSHYEVKKKKEAKTGLAEVIQEKSLPLRSEKRSKTGLVKAIREKPLPSRSEKRSQNGAC